MTIPINLGELTMVSSLFLLINLVDKRTVLVLDELSLDF